MKGKIVLAPFPFTDLAAAKLRPALVIVKGEMEDQQSLQEKFMARLAFDPYVGLRRSRYRRLRARNLEP